jgi:hypothetical protein
MLARGKQTSLAVLLDSLDQGVLRHICMLVLHIHKLVTVSSHNQQIPPEFYIITLDKLQGALVAGVRTRRGMALVQRDNYKSVRFNADDVDFLLNHTVAGRGSIDVATNPRQKVDSSCWAAISAGIVQPNVDVDWLGLPSGKKQAARDRAIVL